ncbi:MAG: DUF4351 domain-containing protein, partial [Nostoc sp.]|uniref:DUF4351 domain-containing protein n=1 Tax=Nostoc sp. TaxID=1180 RepID=UPI002FF89EF0
HVALSVLSTIYSQRIPRELFYNLSDFSNTLLEQLENLGEALLDFQAIADLETWFKLIGIEVA